MRSVIDVYSELARANPAWSPEEEAAFVKKWWRKDRNYFVNEALKHNLGLVFKVVNKVAFNPNNEDIVQKAVIALSNALRKYKPGKGKISTWVHNPIKWAIQQAQNAYTHNGSIADELSCLNNRFSLKLSVVSVDAEIDGGKSDSDKGDTIGSLISAGSVNHDYFNSRGYKTTDEIERENDIRDGVEELMAELPQILTAREIVVVKGIMEGKNLAEIGKTLKLSRMRISQISRDVFAKIKKSPLGGKLKSLI